MQARLCVSCFIKFGFIVPLNPGDDVEDIIKDST